MVCPIPASLHQAPTANGMVVPFVTLTHRDGSGVRWGQLDPARVDVVLSNDLCQLCGKDLDTDNPAAHVVVVARTTDLLFGMTSEPGMHPVCASYTTRACPMLNGHLSTYRSQPQTAAPCGDSLCQCRSWAVPSDAGSGARSGQPAPSWYAFWLAANAYEVVSKPAPNGSGTVRGPKLDWRAIVKAREVRAGSSEEAADAVTILDQFARINAILAME